MDNGMLEHRYRALRNHLDKLGYQYPLAVESLPLVERLVSDLLHTTERLRHYKELAQKSFEESRILQLGVEPYKLDNAKLVEECNDLHLKLLHQQEDADKNQKDLKLQIRELKSENSDLQFLNSQRLARIKTLEQESAQKTRKIVQLQGKGVHTVKSPPGHKKKTLSTKPQATFELDSPLKLGTSWQEQYNSVSTQAKNPYVANLLELADQQISNLNREINFLKEEKIQQSDVVATLKNKLENRDKEIQRLRGMLEGGRPIDAVRKDCQCTCKDMTHQLNTLSNEINILERKKRELEEQVEESVSSQHEAMTRAVMLADRNKQLEKELRDMDQVALAVEAECNSAVQENTMRVSKIQVQLENSLRQIAHLEQEMSKMQRTNQELKASLKRMRNEKDELQRKSESARDEKKYSDRINELTIIERDLNEEIEHLIEETTLQKRRIAELESQLASRVTDLGTVTGKTQKKVHPEERPKNKVPTKAPKDKRDGSIDKRTSSPENGVQLNSEQYEALIERLQSERDFYYSECCRLREETGATASCTNCSELQRKLSEKEQQLQELQQANRDLIKEKEILRSLPHRETHSTMTSPTYISPGTDPASGVSWMAVIKHLEQERDLARGNVKSLEEERDALRERLKIATETQITAHTRRGQAITESEEKVRRLEAEKRELLASQGALKVTVSSLESQIESLQSQLFAAQSELTQRARREKITDSDDIVRKLEAEKRELLASQEAHKVTVSSLESQIESLQNHLFAAQSELTQRARREKTITDSEDIIRKLEAEKRELLASQGAHKVTVSNFEGQIESLQSQLFAAQSELTQRARREKTITDSEERVRKLETEKRELLASQGAQKVTVSSLENQIESLQSQLFTAQSELAQHARREKTIADSEERVRRLEAEKRELLASEGAHKVTVSNFESQIESLQNQLFTTQSELTQQRALYNQIKTLQEQTDRALTDSQGKVIQSEMELTNCRERVRQLERDRARSDQEVALLKNEISVMRGTLAEVDREKDELLINIDNKTERAVTLEQELKAKEDRLQKTEEALTETRKKLSTAMDDIASRDAKARSIEQDAKSLRHELKMLEQARESALAESRLLHSDLANITENLRRANSDLESSRREVENLKHQLQEYVSEVRRVEELLAKKEGERNEMLDHFRSLSVEASALESNNHSLETEVQDTRMQLRIAKDRITDLEHLLETKDTLVNSCERQIAELSGNIARLETQIHEESTQRHRTEEDLSVVRDLCTKLDTQKDNLMQQVTESGLTKMQLETELARLRDEQKVLHEKLTKSHESIATLENLLSSCRKEMLDQKLAHEETQAELKRLHLKITDMKEKLGRASSELQQSQQQVAELTHQVSELQRSVTNERFERARLEEECRRTITLSDSQGSSTNHADIQDTDEEGGASSSTDL
ncbi:centrosomal protein of 135 kDa isoform X2 [Cryptotermes secundus]|nr:centrosomal protein of 135 kDa isoform X2 [Cryptotermes secundus]XP_023719196.1 centrosomal protein of 135 kDa isoform X2 [Cryptotermes secundus]